MGSSAGATQFYNFMQGKYGITGEFFINSVTGLPTTYALSGDPVTHTGWIDGILHPPGDRRLGLSTGPFQMVPGDEQTIVIAELAAGAMSGISHLDAVSLVKYYSDLAQNFYDTSFPVSVLQNKENTFLVEFQLFQNYPNPFNPTTIIKYTIATPNLPQGEAFVKLKVYDVLGNAIATLVNEEKPAGSYEVEFDGTGLTSGIYFYQLKAGNYIETKKMVLLR
jgi:hypothetical protein